MLIFEIPNINIRTFKHKFRATNDKNDILLSKDKIFTHFCLPIYICLVYFNLFM